MVTDYEARKDELSAAASALLAEIYSRQGFGPSPEALRYNFRPETLALLDQYRRLPWAVLGSLQRAVLAEMVEPEPRSLATVFDETVAAITWGQALLEAVVEAMARTAPGPAGDADRLRIQGVYDAGRAAIARRDYLALENMFGAPLLPTPPI